MYKNGYPVFFFALNWPRSFTAPPPATFLSNLPNDGNCTFCEAPNGDY